MKLEYLFLDKNNKEEVLSHNYTIENQAKSAQPIIVTTKDQEFSGSEKWTFLITANKDNEQTAKHLSNINDYIKEFNPIVLINESAEYFNKSIYPLANQFERKLRKLLSLKCSLYNENEYKNKELKQSSKRILKEIESMTYNSIYTHLFTDKSFISRLRDVINNKDSSREYYQTKMNDIPETVLWDVIMDNSDNYIKNNFLLLNDYRNDVMHAHNITYSDYKLHRKAFEKAIESVDGEISKIIQYPDSADVTKMVINSLFNKIDIEKLQSSIQAINGLTSNIDIPSFDYDKIKDIINNINNSKPIEMKWDKMAELFKFIYDNLNNHDPNKKSIE